VPYQVFPAHDGHLIIACGNDTQFRALCSVLDMPALPDDPAYATNPARVENREALSALLSERTGQKTRDDMIAALEAANVSAGPINTVEDALSNPQFLHRGLRIAPEGIPGFQTPILYSRSQLDLQKSAPLLPRR